MAKKNISKVLTNPDLIAANNPQYGGEVVPNTTNVVGTPVGSAVVTPQGNIPTTVQPQTQVVQPTQQVQTVQPAQQTVVQRPNMFKLTPEQEASMTYTEKELEAGHHLVGERAKVQPQTTPTVQGGGFTVSDVKSRPQITSMDELAAALDYTTPEQEEKLRKASVNNQRILAVADALRHIGNIANTVNYAPAQKFNQPWAEEQARYEHGKAQRDAANARYRTYQQMRAEQDRKIRQWEAEQQYKRDKDAAQAEALEKYREGQLKAKEAETARKKENDERNYELRKGTDAWRREQGQQRIDISASKKGGSSGGRRKSKAGSGGGKYWIDVPGKGRIYYPNQTMWKQGIEQYGDENERYETVQKGTDSSGKPIMKQVSTPYAKRAASLSKGGTRTKKRKSGTQL